MHASTGQKKVSSSNTTKVAPVQAWIATPAAATSGNARTATRIDSLAQLPGADHGGCFDLPLAQLLGNEEIDQLIPFLERPDVQVSVLCLNLSRDVDPQALARLLAVLDARRVSLGLRSLPVRVNGREGGDIDLALRLELAKSKSALYLGGESVYALICPQVNAPWLLDHVKNFACFGDGSWSPTGWNDRPLSLSCEDKEQMWKNPVLVRAVATLSHSGRIGFVQQTPLPEHLEQLKQAQAPFALSLYCGDDDAYRLSQWLAVPRPQLQVLDLNLLPRFAATIVELFKCQPSLRWARVQVSRVAVIDWTAHPSLPTAAGAVSLTLLGGETSAVLQHMLVALNPAHLALKNAAEPTDAAEPMAKAFCEGLSTHCPSALLSLTLVWDKYTHDLPDKLALLLQGLVLRGLRLEMRGALGCKPSELTELVLACVPLLRGFELVDVTQPSSPKRLFSCVARWVEEEWQHAAETFLQQTVAPDVADVGKRIVEVGKFSLQDLRSMAMVQRSTPQNPREVARNRAQAIVVAMRYRAGHRNRFDAERDKRWMSRLEKAHPGVASDVYALLVNEPELRDRFF